MVSESVVVINGVDFRIDVSPRRRISFVYLLPVGNRELPPAAERH